MEKHMNRIQKGLVPLGIIIAMLLASMFVFAVLRGLFEDIALPVEYAVRIATGIVMVYLIGRWIEKKMHQK